MYNYKLVYFCQRCRQEYDRTQEPMFDTGIKCDCGGYIITPSGRANMQIKLLANVYLIQGDKYIAWIGSKNKRDAEAHFIDQFKDRIHKTNKLSDEDMIESKFAYDIKHTNKLEDFIWQSAKDVLLMSEQLPIVIYGVEIDKFEEARKKRENDEL